MDCHLKGLFIPKELNIQLANMQDTVGGAESSVKPEEKGTDLVPITDDTFSFFFFIPSFLSFFSLNSRDMHSSLVRQPRVSAEKLFAFSFFYETVKLSEKF